MGFTYLHINTFLVRGILLFIFSSAPDTWINISKLYSGDKVWPYNLKSQTLKIFYKPNCFTEFTEFNTFSTKLIYFLIKILILNFSLTFILKFEAIQTASWKSRNEVWQYVSHVAFNSSQWESPTSFSFKVFILSLSPHLWFWLTPQHLISWLHNVLLMSLTWSLLHLF